MNLPNKLTVLRVLMIPVFLVFFWVERIPHNFLWALIVFLLASLTDMLDGQIARRRGLVTDFGKLMDPLADKLLVMAAMVSLCGWGLVHAVVVALILGREFLVTSIRQIAAGKGRVIAADVYGKIKTVFQMVWLAYCLLILWIGGVFPLSFGAAEWIYRIYLFLTAWVLAFTVFSGYNYVKANRDLFADA